MLPGKAITSISKSCVLSVWARELPYQYMPFVFINIGLLLSYDTVIFAIITFVAGFCYVVKLLPEIRPSPLLKNPLGPHQYTQHVGRH